MANYATQCRNCGGYFPGNSETNLCYSCLEKELQRERETQEAIDYLEPLIEHPTFTGRFCKYLKFAVEALKEPGAKAMTNNDAGKALMQSAAMAGMLTPGFGQSNSREWREARTMREIKLRGKRIDNGKWVYGYYCLTTCYAGKPIRKAVIISESELCNNCLWGVGGDDSPVEVHEINPATVGQFTGLPDIDGCKIYNGDITETITRKRLLVKWIGEAARFSLITDEGHIYCDLGQFMVKELKLMVIGNRFDNPELLEGGSHEAE